MPVVMAKARARIAAIVMAITQLQRCLELSGPGAALLGWSIKNDRDAKQTIATAVKYPMRSAAIVISSITLPQFGTMLQKQTKSCALRHTRDCGRNGIIPGPQVEKR